MAKKTPNRLLALISKKYYGAYMKMFDELRPFLTDPDQSCWTAERLEFRTDWPRGSKKLVYQAIARLMAAAPDGNPMDDDIDKIELFRWLTDPKHSNLDLRADRLQTSVYRALRDVV